LAFFACASSFVSTMSRFAALGRREARLVLVVVGRIWASVTLSLPFVTFWVIFCSQQLRALLEEHVVVRQADPADVLLVVPGLRELLLLDRVDRLLDVLV
jgi:hypothetical protein